jgi:biopolymer transport protein ExbB
MRNRWLLLLLALAFAVTASDALAQAAKEATAAVGDETRTRQTFWDIVLEDWPIMSVLLITSVVMMGLIVEGFFRIRLEVTAPTLLYNQLKELFQIQNYQEAFNLCQSKRAFLTNVVLGGLRRVGQGKNAVDTTIQEHSVREGLRLRTKISYLSVIGVVAPMIGLTGTVYGMIKAFASLGSSGLADPAKLASAIGTVLWATLSGLMIAIPAFLFYYFFRNRAQAVIVDTEERIASLFERVPYDELRGVMIGEDSGSVMAGILARAHAKQSEKLEDAKKRVSQAITGVTVACPVCNAPIREGDATCNACGTELQWS